MFWFALFTAGCGVRRSSTFSVHTEQECSAFHLSTLRRQSKPGHSQGVASVSCFSSFTAAALAPLGHCDGARSQNVLLFVLPSFTAAAVA